jgi:hypothetical protein
VGIVMVFTICHLFRLVLQLDAALNPLQLGEAHFQEI